MIADIEEYQLMLIAEDERDTEEKSQLNTEQDAFVAKENELLNVIGGKSVTQNLSRLAEEKDEELDEDNETEEVESKAGEDTGPSNKVRDPEAELEKAFVLLVQMCSEHDYECQQWRAERQAERQQWQNDNQQWSAGNQCLADHCSALESQMTKEASYQQKEVRLKLHFLDVPEGLLAPTAVQQRRDRVKLPGWTPLQNQQILTK